MNMASQICINCFKINHLFLSTGDLIILIAQIISATQVVLEEKFVNGKDILPLQAVGWEGKYQVYSRGKPWACFAVMIFE